LLQLFRGWFNYDAIKGVYMETYVYIGAGVAVIVILFWFMRRKNNSPMFKNGKSGGDTINANNSNVNTGTGDQTN